MSDTEDTFKIKIKLQQGAGAMAQWIKCLLEDVSSDPNTHRKTWMQMAHASNLSAVSKDSVAKSVSSRLRETLCLK